MTVYFEIEFSLLYLLQMNLCGPVYNPFMVLLPVLCLGAYALIFSFALIGLRKFLEFGCTLWAAFCWASRLPIIQFLHLVLFVSPLFFFSLCVFFRWICVYLKQFFFFCLPKDRN